MQEMSVVGAMGGRRERGRAGLCHGKACPCGWALSEHKTRDLPRARRPGWWLVEPATGPRLAQTATGLRLLQTGSREGVLYADNFPALPYIHPSNALPSRLIGKTKIAFTMCRAELAVAHLLASRWRKKQGALYSCGVTVLPHFDGIRHLNLKAAAVIRVRIQPPIRSYLNAASYRVPQCNRVPLDEQCVDRRITVAGCTSFQLLSLQNAGASARAAAAHCMEY